MSLTRTTIAILPLLLLPLFAATLRGQLPAWAVMWLLAAALYAGCKWLMWTRQIAGRGLPVWKSLGFLLLWPGMNPAPFTQRQTDAQPPGVEELCAAAVKFALGIAALWAATQYAAPDSLWPAWLGAVGILLLLHFGLMHAAAVLWRALKVPVEPIMDRPVFSTSLAALWSRRWNTAFSHLGHVLILRPLQPRLGSNAALAAVFLISGLLHELLISFPARSGYGLPTAYFLLQALGLAIERSALGRRALSNRFAGWLFCLLIAGLPAYWLFHPAFMHAVITPLLLAVRDALRFELQIDLAKLLQLAGVLHFTILFASALVPKVLAWKESLAQVSALMRHVVWTHGVFIVLVIIAFGTLSLLHADTLAGGTPLARSVCAFIALFWGARLFIQLVLFDIRPHVSSQWLRLGYHMLTVVFTVLTALYGIAALV